MVERTLPRDGPKMADSGYVHATVGNSRSTMKDSVWQTAPAFIPCAWKAIRKAAGAAEPGKSATDGLQILRGSNNFRTRQVRSAAPHTSAGNAWRALPARA